MYDELCAMLNLLRQFLTLGLSQNYISTLTAEISLPKNLLPNSENL